MNLFKRNNFLLVLTFLAVLNAGTSKTNSKQKSIIDDVSDLKDFKKLIRSRNNVLALFVENNANKQISKVLKIFKEVANLIRGTGTMLLMDCSHSEKKKLCKKLRATPEPYVLKHYKNGEFHTDYARQLTINSMVNFMRDPSGDLPWDEDPLSVDVLHFQNYETFAKHIKKDPRPMLIMFYVPWCTFCKKLKPDYSKAATELKGKDCIIAAMNLERPENGKARKIYNITGFPTILYFKDGKVQQTYGGENNKDAIINFMNDPSGLTTKKPKPDGDWADDTNSEIVHLTARGFESAIKDEPSVLVMFYVPWCGHCKRMKPEYEKSALLMKEQNVNGILAALDATKEPDIAEKFQIRGYPTFKYFVFGEYKYDVNIREAAKLVEFMKDPKEPPPRPPAEKSWEEEDNEIIFLNEDNFAMTLRNKEHALVMFFAPWCTHCKNAKPEFAAAAETLKDEERVLIAAVDCSQHDILCKTEKVTGYPTIRYYSYLKSKSDFPRSRKHEEFVGFLQDKLNDHDEL